MRSSHPEPMVAVTAGVTALAAATGRSAPGLVAVAAAILSGQLAVGLSNDFLDAERDAASGRADKPVATGAVSRRTVGRAALLTAVACVPLSLLSGWRAGLVHLVCVASALSYNARLKSTAFSVVPYAVSFGLLPAFVTLGLPGAPLPPLWLVAAGAALGSGAHFANVLPDLEDDAATGVRGLPHRLGRRRSAALAAALMLVTALLLALGPVDLPAVVGWTGLGGTALVLGAGSLLGSRAAFRAVLVAAVLDIVLLLFSGAHLR